jgi:hypothetical protein
MINAELIDVLKYGGALTPPYKLVFMKCIMIIVRIVKI